MDLGEAHKALTLPAELWEGQSWPSGVTPTVIQAPVDIFKPVLRVLIKIWSRNKPIKMGETLDTPHTSPTLPSR